MGSRAIALGSPVRSRRDIPATDDQPGLTNVEVGSLSLERFQAVLAPDEFSAVRAGRERARTLLAGRTVWNVSSTAHGGGVAEMLVSLLAYARGASVDARWIVIGANKGFFGLTKRIHNRLHGFTGDGGPLGDNERAAHRAQESATRHAPGRWECRRPRGTATRRALPAPGSARSGRRSAGRARSPRRQVGSARAARPHWAPASPRSRGAHTDTHLVYAGPAVEAVSDDPEGAAVLEQAHAQWSALSEPIRARIHLALLPMDDPQENAAVVNALQRGAEVVVQKSLAEGFGLTVAEAMWKSRPVVASRLGGIQDQIQDGRSGVLLDDPRDLPAFGRAVNELLDDPTGAAAMGAAAATRVRDQFLGPRSLLAYLELLGRLL
jgi:glycosyltransferase involved in cell wall biosynthesis